MNRYTRPLLDWLAAVALALIFAEMLVVNFDTVEAFHRGESAAADAAIAEHLEEIKALRAAIDMCGGENSVAQDMGNGSWQCFNKHRQAITARVEK